MPNFLVSVNSKLCSISLLSLLFGLIPAQLPAAAEVTGRPSGLSLQTFQSGPMNRWAFSHLREVLPTAAIKRDPAGFQPLAISDEFSSDFSVSLEGQEKSIDEIAAAQFIDGLLVLKDGKIVAERYYGQLAADRPHLLNSVSKSIVGLLARKLAADGVIDLSLPVSHYVPELAESGYGPDSLETVLDMQDGSDYREDYEDLSSTFRMQDCAIGWSNASYCPANGPKSLFEFLPTVGRDEAQVGTFEYRSGSVNAIAWVLEAATNQPLAALISDYIWQPMGAEFDANITIDQGGFALADHGISTTLRDLGRFGLLMLNDGQSFGNQVVPASVLQDIKNTPGDPNWSLPSPDGYKPFYRSFWWGEGNPGGDVSGLGIHGQIVHVVPKDGLVIAMFSSWPRAEANGPNVGWDATGQLMDALIAKFR